MTDNVTFVDLVALTRITPDATAEKFGGLINSSFFDASNILGSLKQKGLVDFVTAFPTQSTITLTELGKQLVADADQKATEPFDKLDMEILTQMSNGKRTLPEISGGVNVTQKDLAIHLYKISKQQFISYELRNGNVNLSMTEKGFLHVKESSQQQPEGKPMHHAHQQSQPTSVNINVAAPASPTDLRAGDEPKGPTPLGPEEVHALALKRDRIKGITVFVIILIVVIILYVAEYHVFYIPYVSNYI
jgi:hypothetical protein